MLIISNKNAGLYEWVRCNLQNQGVVDNFFYD